MGWAIGMRGGRDIGYGVPAVCDQPDCNEEIDRGLSFCCGGYVSDDGCGLYFCYDHLFYEVDSYEDSHEFCDSCCIRIKLNRIDPDIGWELFPAGYEPKPDTLSWVLWKYYDHSWMDWRVENKAEARKLYQRIHESDQEEVIKLMKVLLPEMEQNQSVVE